MADNKAQHWREEKWENVNFSFLNRTVLFETVGFCFFVFVFQLVACNGQEGILSSVALGNMN